LFKDKKGDLIFYKTGLCIPLTDVHPVARKRSGESRRWPQENA